MCVFFFNRETDSSTLRLTGRSEVDLRTVQDPLVGGLPIKIHTYLMEHAGFFKQIRSCESRLDPSRFSEDRN